MAQVEKGSKAERGQNRSLNVAMEMHNRSARCELIIVELQAEFHIKEKVAVKSAASGQVIIALRVKK